VTLKIFPGLQIFRHDQFNLNKVGGQILMTKQIKKPGVPAISSAIDGVSKDRPLD
jgi:hypothetical protein